MLGKLLTLAGSYVGSSGGLLRDEDESGIPLCYKFSVFEVYRGDGIRPFFCLGHLQPEPF